ncbi:MAG: tetratricopeptide repeat protein [Thermotogota bacterium]
MKKISLFVLILFISIITFSFGYDELLKDAQEFAFKGDYKKAENLYSKLIEDFQTEELFISYANTLAWQGKYNEAIKLLDNSGIESNPILETKAKILIWAKDYEKGIRILENLKNKEYALSPDIQDLLNDYYNFKFNNIFANYKTEVADEQLSSELSLGYTYNNRDKYKIGFSTNLGLLNYSYNSYSFQSNFSKDIFNIYLGLSDKQYYFLGAELYLSNFITTYKNSLYKGNEDISLNFSLLNEISLGYSHSFDRGYLNVYGIFINTTDFFESQNENTFSYYFKTNFNFLNFNTNYNFNFKDVNDFNVSYKFYFDTWNILLSGEYNFITDSFMIGTGFDIIF